MGFYFWAMFLKNTIIIISFSISSSSNSSSSSSIVVVVVVVIIVVISSSSSFTLTKIRLDNLDTYVEFCTMHPLPDILLLVKCNRIKMFYFRKPE